MTKLKEINVVYVDDEIHNLNSFVATFRRDFNVFVASSAAEGFKILKNYFVHIVITDQRMPGMSGVEFLTRVSEEYPATTRVLVTGFTDAQVITDALSNGQVHYRIEKPWDAEKIRAIIADVS